MPTEGVVAVKYSVKAKRWEKGWELHIADVGVTQVRMLADAPQQAADYIETLLDVEVDPKDITVTPQLQERTLIIEARKARQEVRKAEMRMAKAAARQRQVAAALRRKEHLSVSDTATVMEISRGRVSQLTSSVE